MGSSTYNDASQKQLEDELIDAGSRLLMLPSSADELLVLLEKAESLLTKVCQQPPTSTGDALLPAIKALATDELLKHTDVNIQVAVASCINELTRITAPNPPYSDDEMKEVFQLFMIAFKQLSFEPGRNYSRATQILETVAKVRSCLIWLDIGCDTLIIEMFQLFLTTIRSSHSSNILKYMEMIMTLVIEESDEISSELLRPLLASIKMDNKNITPVSWELGKTVLNNCATKLQPYLRESVKIMNVKLDDYAEILSSLCVETSNGKTMVAKEVASASQIVSVDLSDAGVSKLEDGTPFVKDNTGNGQLISNSVKSDEQLKVVNTSAIVQSVMDKGAARRRGRKPNSLVKVKPKDGYECSLATGGIDSCDISCNGENEEDLALPSKHGKGKVLNDSSQKEYDSVNEVSLRRRGRSKKTENTSKQHGNPELSSPARRILQTMAKETCSSGSKRAGKKGFTGLKIIEANNVEENIDNNAKGKDGLLLQELDERKQISDEIISQKQESVSDKDEMMEYHSLSKPAKAKNLSAFASEKEKKSTRICVSYGDELVNLRIQVWWPIDKRFYAGTVKAFDPLTKRHEIKYDDDEIEVLHLGKERWELLGDKKPGQAPAPTQRKVANHLSPAKDPVKAPIMTEKRKAMSSRKHYATSSSKRSKSESHGGLKPGENSAPDDIHLKDELNDETSETIVISNDVRENHAGNEE